MPIPVTCGGCGKTFNVKDDWAGRAGKCPGCGGRITVPGPAPQMAEPAATPPPPVPPQSQAPPPYAAPPVAPQGYAPPPARRPRPGGLTALAVLNFVFGGLGVIGLFALFALLSLADEGIRGMSLGRHGVSDVPGAGTVYFLLFLSLVAVVLLITSGVGYIGQKRVLGKCLGNAYGILGIASNALGIVLVGTAGVSNILGLIYPVLTLALLNTSFKDDFPN
ncbi:MAG: hypothetical protein FJ290_10025 [Planctomycetes bacterium]|nr:hypothetical protein [Planctomycetota bacterium]